ncbi:hypothetical protein D3C76_1473210 [compost metagenome]
MLVSDTGAGINVEFVAIGTNPATGLAVVHAHFAHAAAQGAEFAIPDRRRGIEQGQN